MPIPRWKGSGRWDEADLLRRVCAALDFAARTLESITDGFAEEKAPDSSTLRLPSEKVVAETAMLLLFAASIQTSHDRVRERVETIARLLVPHARSDGVLAAICLEPGFVRDHAVAHAILSRLGLPDPAVDRLFSESLAMGHAIGPERLAYRQLEQEWLARVWNVGVAPSRSEPRLPALSLLGRPLDTLACARDDVYAFTHAAMYLSDLGTRRARLPRSRAAIVADAEAGLAYSLDRDDFDLAAEVVLTWPMLRLPWSSIAIFAFHLLTAVQDELGFLPGLAFDRVLYQSLRNDEQFDYVLATSYHTNYVMGFLSAALLTRGSAPPVAVPNARRTPGVGEAILQRIDADASSPRWRRLADELARGQLDSIAPLVLAVALRRATACGDLKRVRELLELALVHGVVDGLAPAQAAALLRRGAALEEAKSRSHRDM